MKKKLVGVLLTAAMAVSALAGCGSKQAAAPAESKAAEEKTETVQEATEEAEAAEGEEVLTVWCWDPNFNVYAMKQAEALYQKEHPNFKLDIQEKSSEKLSFSSAAKTRLSSCSSRELVSKRYASKMLSFPLPIGTSFLCVELLMFRSTGLAKK